MQFGKVAAPLEFGGVFMEEQRSAHGIPFPLSDAALDKAALASELSSVIAQSEALLLQGRPREAEQLLRQCLARKRSEPAIISALVRVLLAQGRAQDGLGLIDNYCAATASPALPILLQRAQILLEMGHLKEAIAAFHHAIAAAPGNGVAHLGLAVALGQDGQSHAANASAQAAIAKGLDNAGSRSVLARSFFEMRQYDEAEAEFHRTLMHKPWDTAAHSALAELIWMRTRDIRAALAEIDRAVRQFRDARALDLQVVRARIMRIANCHVEAKEELERLISSNPNHLTLRIMAAQTSIDMDAARAALHAEHAMRLAPSHAGVAGLYADTMLATGRPEVAANIAERLLTANPHDNHAIALQTASWRLLDDPRYRPFHDYESLVQACMLDVPDGWSDLDHYLSDLAEDLRHEHALLAEPVDQSVRRGTQVEHRVTETPMPAIRALPKAIHGPIDRYMNRLRIGDTPWHKRVTGNYRLNGLWSVRLQPHGHHVNHFHGKGWISSACYIEVPEAVNNGDKQGWLKFGEPGLITQPALSPDYFVRPVPGMLVLFPSWMWHGTVPFTSATEEHRLTMAFDVVPVAAV